MPILVNDSYLSYREDAARLILAALTEHAKGFEHKLSITNKKWDELLARNDAQYAELTALRAVADEMEGALKEIADYGRGSRHGEGICPYGCDAPDIAQKALTRYAALRAGEKGAV